MKILVTGASGFVGRHVVTELLRMGHEVVVAVRNAQRMAYMPWRDDVQQVSCDIHGEDAAALFEVKPQALIHLAWNGLPNYQQAFHIEKNLPSDYRFLSMAVASGIRHLLVTGTGAEFGMAEGALAENAQTAPVTAYGIAKDSLHKYLGQLQKHTPFTLQWVRLFHLYGPGQHPNSLLAQLERAIARSASAFPMSQGEQLRDYLPVQTVALKIALLVSRPDIDGALHCCSGRPISVRRLVENRCRALGSDISLHLGAYPYPAYESMAYWGIPGKMRALSSQMGDKTVALHP